MFEALNQQGQSEDGAGDIGALFASLLRAWGANDLDTGTLNILYGSEQAADVVVSEDRLQWLAMPKHAQAAPF
jgi:hypothetical protein